MQKITQMTEARAEALLEIAKNGGDIVGISELARRRDVERQSMQRIISILEDSDYIEVDRRPNGAHIALTHTGWTAAYRIGGGLQAPDTNRAESYEMYVKRLHGIVTTLTLQNREQLPDRWRGRIQKRSDLRWMSVEEEDNEFYVAVVEGFTVQLHRNSITAHLREPVEAWTVNGAVRELVKKLQRLRERLAKTVGAAVSIQNVDIERAECALEQHHLAMLVDELEGVRLQDIFVKDQEEEDRKEVTMDKSPGMPEIETKGQDRAIEIANTVEDWLRFIAHEPNALQKLMDMGRTQTEEQEAEDSGSGWSSETGWGWEW